MVIEKLSLATINATSPYLVKIADDGKALCFVTDYDAEMFITFEKDDLLHNGTVYQFGISNPKKVRSPKDPKVRATILAIIEKFFAKNQAAFLYICETGDGRNAKSSLPLLVWHLQRPRGIFVLTANCL